MKSYYRFVDCNKCIPPGPGVLSGKVVHCGGRRCTGTLYLPFSFIMILKLPKNIKSIFKNRFIWQLSAKCTRGESD